MFMVALRRNAIVAQQRVTPDDAQAAALRRKQAALSYAPQNGFHKDRIQDRRAPAARWALRSA